jgi:hypothetical protein
MPVLKRRDVSRLQKIYPFSRRKPRYKFISDTEGIIESGKIEITPSLTDQSTFEYIFREDYSSMNNDPIICLGTFSPTGEIFSASVIKIDMTADQPSALISTSSTLPIGSFIYIHVMEFKNQ